MKNHKVIKKHLFISGHWMTYFKIFSVFKILRVKVKVKIFVNFSLMLIGTEIVKNTS